MKNKYLFAFLFAFIAISTTAFSQINCGTKDQIKQFMASETYFVDDLARNKYNDAVDKVLDSCWSVTSADKMTPEEFEKQFNNKKFSFVYLSVNTIKEDTAKQTFLCMNVTVGGKGKNISKLPDLGSFPIGYETIDEDDFIYKVGGLMRMVENHIKLCESNPDLKSEGIVAEYNKNIKTVCNKEIWFLAEDLDEKVNTPEKIKTVGGYPFPVKIATKEEIQKAIFESNPNVIFLHKAGPEGKGIGKKCWKFLIDASTGEVKMLNISKIDKKNSNTFTMADFKKLPKKITVPKTPKAKVVKPAKPAKGKKDEGDGGDDENKTKKGTKKK